MNYSIKLNAVNNPEKNVKAFATVTFGDAFKITNIAVVEGKENQPFVSMLLTQKMKISFLQMYITKKVNLQILLSANLK